MPAPCCPESFAGSMRPCPRCSTRWICHHCGVKSRGSLVCADCVNRPDPQVTSPDVPLLAFANLSRLPAAFGAGMLGSLLGGLAWAGASAVLGAQYGALGILAGIGARLGVRAALVWSAGCAWPFVSAAATFPGYFLGRWLFAFIAARNAAGGSAVSPFGHAVWSNFTAVMTRGFGLVELCWLGVAMVVAAVPFRNY